MAIYIIEVALVFLLWPILNNKQIKTFHNIYKGQDVYLYLIFIMYTIVMCLRSPSVGSDTRTYVHMFERIMSTPSLIDALKNAEITAPVYIIYAYIIGKIFGIPQAITIFNSIIVCYFICRFIKKTSTNYFLSCLLYIAIPLYFESMNGTRQFMAIALSINSLLYIIESKKSVKGWTLYILAIGIHTISLFFLIGIFLNYVFDKNKKRKNILIESILWSVGFVILFQTMLSLISLLLPYYAQYLNGYNPVQINSNTGSGRIAYLYYVLGLSIIMIVLFGRKNLNIINSEGKERYVIYFLPLVVFCVIVGIFNAKNFLINRLLWYYLILFIVFLPNGFKFINFKRKKIVISIIVALLMMYGTIHLVEDKSDIVPYTTFYIN